MLKKYKLEDYITAEYNIAVSFSPDGEKICIMSNKTGRRQLYVANRDGTNLDQLTHLDDSIQSCTYSPINDEIIYSLSKNGNENFQLYIIDVATKNTRALTSKSNVKHIWGGWSKDGRYIAYSSNERNRAFFDVYVMELATGIVKCVFEQDDYLAVEGFSPTGRYVLVSRVISGFSNELHLVDLQHNATRLLLDAKNDTLNRRPAWLPDESGFYYLTDKDSEFLFLSRYDLTNNSSQCLLKPNYGLSQLSITPDGKYLIMCTDEDGYGQPQIYLEKGLRLVKDQKFPIGSSFSVFSSKNSKYLIVNCSSETELDSSWLMDIESNSLIKITQSKIAVPSHTFVKPDLVHYKSFDGLDIPSFIYTPKNSKQGSKLPVIINIHGGPKAQYRPAFDAMSQYFAQSGFIVACPNIRGSTGYGRTYRHLDDTTKRMDAVSDIVSLRDYLSTREDVEINKIVLCGGSYGGYMVLACLAFYPDLWAAGIDVCGISNFVTFLQNTASYRRHLREIEYGSLEQNRDFLESVSPFNFVEDIKAPLYIVHGKHDPRVPLSEAEQIYDKLKAQGNKVELTVYENEGHGISKRENNLDLWPRVVRFLDEAIGLEAPRFDKR